MPLGSRIYSGTISGSLRKFSGGPLLYTKCRYLGSGWIDPNSEDDVALLQTIDITFSWRWSNNVPSLYGYGTAKTVHENGNLEFVIMAASSGLLSAPLGIIPYTGGWAVSWGTGTYAQSAGSTGTFVGRMGWSYPFPLPPVFWPTTLGFDHSYTGLLRYAT